MIFSTGSLRQISVQMIVCLHFVCTTLWYICISNPNLIFDCIQKLKFFISDINLQVLSSQTPYLHSHFVPIKYIEASVQTKASGDLDSIQRIHSDVSFVCEVWLTWFLSQWESTVALGFSYHLILVSLRLYKKSFRIAREQFCESKVSLKEKEERRTLLS